MKRFHVTTVGNALVDIFVNIEESFLVSENLEKATMRLVDIDEQKRLLGKVENSKPHLASGGSVCNSIFTISQLGGNGALFCCLGDDRYGIFFKSECESRGLELGNPLIVGESTGTCLVMNTPDGERTMRTCLAVSAKLSTGELNEEIIKESEWLLLEGYPLANGEDGTQALLEALSLAREYGTKVAFTCSEPWVVATCGEAVKKIVSTADLVFCNREEAISLAGSGSSAEEAFNILSEKLPGILVTDGPNGAYVSCSNERGHIPGFPAKAVDLTGAGDAFAGTFLYGITHGVGALKAARGACFLASKVVSQVGARLHTGTKDYWLESQRI